MILRVLTVLTKTKPNLTVTFLKFLELIGKVYKTKEGRQGNNVVGVLTLQGGDTQLPQVFVMWIIVGRW